jgi:MinD-like ATPase involved in chromosome partitioning or flagellar assembly
MDWLNENLKMEIKKVFELRYNKKLSREEIQEIASNLVSYFEHQSKFAWRIKNESRI